MKVYVDPMFDIQHSGFYLKALESLLGPGCLEFSNRYSQGQRQNSDILSLVVESDDGKKSNVILDFGDSPNYRERLYEWADVYAKTNIREDDFPQYPKSMPLGRGLPLRAFSPLRTLWIGISNLPRCRDRITDWRSHLSTFRAMAFRALTQQQYDHPGRSENDYVHFVCTPWKNDAETNGLRANFMRAVKSLPGMVFEGGFSPRPDGYDPGYPDLMWKPFEPLETYMRKTLRSLVVFNNPAVKGCHSWKLAEYLSWGKAIVSTPPIRMLPAPLEDGVHILYTDGTLEDMTEKVRLLREDEELRRTIERNARAYYDEHLAADRVMASVLRRAGVALPGGS